MSQIELGVRLIGDGDGGWAMVPAQEVMANIYVILDNAAAEETGRELEFKPGNLVTVMEEEDADGRPFLAAFRLYGGLPL